MLRVEKLLAGFGDADKATPEFQQALARISADEAAQRNFLAAVRRAAPGEARAKMISVGGHLGWLSDDQKREEQAAMVSDLLARPSLGFADVDLACTLNRDRHLDAERHGIAMPPAHAGKAAHAAVLACMGSEQAHGEVLRALASASESDVQAAQAYLRHRPIEPEDLRRVARDVTRMQGPAQVRAIDAIARLNISDREVLGELSRTFAQTRSADVQRAIAEVFVRADPKALPKPGLAQVIRQHRLKPRGGGQDLIDVLLARLQAAG